MLSFSHRLSTQSLLFASIHKAEPWHRHNQTFNFENARNHIKKKYLKPLKK